MPRKHYPLKHTKKSHSARRNWELRRKKQVHEESHEDVLLTDPDEIFNRLISDTQTPSTSGGPGQDDSATQPARHNDSGSDSERSYHSGDSLATCDDSDYELPPLIVEKFQCTETITVPGRRIIDFTHFSKELEEIHNHGRQCTMGKYKLQREVRNGLFSTFVYFCDNCEKERFVTSLPIQHKDDLNDALVWGATSVGIGHSQVEEMFSVLDIPIMGHQKYKNHETKVGKSWEKKLVEKMRKNAEEEKRIAIEKNNYLNGVPCITVIGDGGWAKRTYGHGYNSLSGLGAIIGAHTKKLLFLGVRNKFCFACSNPRKKNEDHECFKNYSGPSTGMESNIIVEGFRRSEEDYGLVYKNYIGDGDSSTFARIQEGCRYGRYVKKIECANHVTRALNENLHKLAENTQFPLESRQMLSKPAPGDSISRLERLVKGVRTAIKEAGVNKSAEDIVNLRHDIRNAPDHVFGNHAKCRAFCNRKDNEEEDVTKKMSQEFLCKIRSCIGNVESKANSLVFNDTTNIAEKYMGCVAKFTGGKRINYTTGGSFHRRCVGAGLAHSGGPSWHLSPWKSLKNKSPGAIFKKKILSREMRRLKRKKLFSESGKPALKRKRREGKQDSEYGPLALEPDIEEEQMEEKCRNFLVKLEADVKNGNEKLQCDTIGQHKNELWQEKRLNRLTASKFGAVAKRLPHTPCHNLVKAILYPKPLNTEAVTFGRDKEDHVVELYEERTGNKVTKCGLFVDLDHPYLGASPDGLVGDDGLLEIKCLHAVKENTLVEDVKSNKKMCLEEKGGKLTLKRSHNYFHQIQGQLNITKRKWCDFVVYTKKEELFIERIEKDVSFWETILPKLVQFYKCCLLPEVVDSRIVRQMRVRDPPYILQAQSKLQKKKHKSETKVKN